MESRVPRGRDAEKFGKTSSRSDLSLPLSERPRACKSHIVAVPGSLRDDSSDRLRTVIKELARSLVDVNRASRASAARIGEAGQGLDRLLWLLDEREPLWEDDRPVHGLPPPAREASSGERKELGPTLLREGRLGWDPACAEHASGRSLPVVEQALANSPVALCLPLAALLTGGI